MKKLLTMIPIIILLSCDSNNLGITEDEVITDKEIFIREYDASEETDSLFQIADKLVENIYLQQTSMDNKIQNQELTIGQQYEELDRQKKEIELKILNAKAAEESAKREIELSKKMYNKIMKEKQEADSLWGADTKQLNYVIGILDTVVMSTMVTMIQMGQKDKLFDESTKINWVIKNYLPPKWVDSIIQNTQVLYSFKELRIKEKVEKINEGKKRRSKGK